MAAFDRLHPSIQHHAVNSLGWRRLRPLQEAAIDPVLAGDHALLLAPTAGGKTEAAVFPILSRIATETWPALSTLYLCPLRALLNNLLPRLERYAAFSGHRVALWHGDVGPAERRRLLVEPPDVLLTTPESLEAMLISTKVDTGFFSRLQAVIVDEVHAFAGADRGWHLLAVLSRMERLSGRELQRVGLSATVGNPAGLLEWLTPGARRPRRVIDPPAEPSPTGVAGAPGTTTGSYRSASAGADVVIDHVGSLDNAATVIAGLHAGEKRLVFVDSRTGAEQLTQTLRGKGITTFVTHASLGRDERRRAEEAFAQRSNCVIVATSALELGIDVGDLDRVIQVGAPGTVASFLQRLGRSGRRDTGPDRNLLFLATAEESLWVACGLTRLWHQGWVEPIDPPALPLHIVAHQLLALVLQEGAVGRNLWREWLGTPFVLGDDASRHADTVEAHLLGHRFLHEDGQLLSLGSEAETRFGRRNFLELTSVFTAPPLFTVLAGRREIGHVHDLSLLAAFGARRDGPPILLLGGRGWRVHDVDWRRRRVHVELTDLAGRTHYRGSGQPHSYDLCQSIRAVLAGESPAVPLSRRAQAALDSSRESFPKLTTSGDSALTVEPDGKTRWWTFAGLRANVELAARLGPLARSARGIDGLSIALIEGTDTGRIQASLDRTTPVHDLLDLAEEMTEGVKFADCLPQEMADAVVLSRLTDELAVTETLKCGVQTIHLDSDK